MGQKRSTHPGPDMKPTIGSFWLTPKFLGRIPSQKWTQTPSIGVLISILVARPALAAWAPSARHPAPGRAKMEVAYPSWLEAKFQLSRIGGLGCGLGGLGGSSSEPTLKNQRFKSPNHQSKPLTRVNLNVCSFSWRGELSPLLLLC